MKDKIKKYILMVICIVLVITLLYYSKEIFLGVSKGINICLNALIPSIYIFMVLACFISISGIDKYIGKFFDKVSKKLFKISGETFSIVLLSFIGGYPIGAKIISDKVKFNQLSSNQAQYLINFCVYCSPAFIISGIAVPLWNNKKIGSIIYIAQILAGIVIAIILSLKQKEVIYIKESTIKNTFCNNIVYAVNNATKAMCLICSFILIFYALFSLLDLLKISPKYSNIFKGLLEVTLGCQLIQGYSLFDSILLVNIFTSFGGLCVFLQLKSILNNCKINFVRFILIRISYTFISSLILYILILFSDINIECFSSQKEYSFHMYTVSPISSIFLLILGLMLLLFYNKSDKIKYSC